MTTGFCYVSQINIKQQLKNTFSFKLHVYGLIHTFDDRQAVALSLISVISSEFMYTTSRCGICNILQSRQIVIKAYIRKQFNFLNIKYLKKKSSMKDEQVSVQYRTNIKNNS